MGKAIGEVLPYAVGVAISPVPIIAAIDSITPVKTADLAVLLSAVGLSG
jgi:hypothetical protein